MKETVAKGVNFVEFDGLYEFNKYITEMPENKPFSKAKYLASKDGNESFRGTKTFDEAISLLENGWEYMAKELNVKMKAKENDMNVTMVAKNILSMSGYQAIVTLYLNRVPNNMVNKRLVPVKQKVITINKILSVSAFITKEVMKQESIKTFMIIKKIEQSGMRVNLNLLMNVANKAIVKIPLKKSTEKINISKLAFPLVHPSMYRRLFFRFIEVYPNTPAWCVDGYGTVEKESFFKKVCKDNDILLPTILGSVNGKQVEALTTEELINRLK